MNNTKQKEETGLIDDPRSPTTEFERTPIVVACKTSGVPEKLHNKNLDNARKQLITLTPGGRILQQKNTPKMLKTPVKSENKRKSLVGMLETNLDYTETDLDEVIQKKLQCVSLEDLNKSVDVCEKIDVDPRSPTIDFVRTPLQVLKKVGEIEVNETQECDYESDDGKFPKEDLTVVKNFDRKLTNLIYEDKAADLIQKPVKTKENNCRTPLGVRNVNNQPNKSSSKLRVSDKPLKQHVVSKIPVFKEKRVKGAQQCENTPPSTNSTNPNKTRKSHWDAERTLII